MSTLFENRERLILFALAVIVAIVLLTTALPDLTTALKVRMERATSTSHGR